MKKTYKIEVEYEYHPSGPSEENPRLHWMYVTAKSNSIKEALAYAKKEYEKRVSGLGWGKIVTLREIRPTKHGHDPINHKNVDPVDVPVPRKSSAGNTKRGQRTSTGSGRTTRTSKRRVKDTKSPS